MLKSKEFSKGVREAASNNAQIRYKDRDGITYYVNRADVLSLKELFKELDTDDSGYIDLKEMEEYMFDKYSVPSAAAALAARFSQGGDFGKTLVAKIEKALSKKDSLSFPDMLQLAYPAAERNTIADMIATLSKGEAERFLSDSMGENKAKQKAKELEQAKQTAWVNEMWPFWDADQSGELDEFEFKGVMRDIGANAKDAEDFFEEIDVDRSGTVSKEEFVDWWIGRGEFENSRSAAK